MSLIISETQTSRLASSFDRDLNSSVGDGQLGIDAKMKNLAVPSPLDVAIADVLSHKIFKDAWFELRRFDDPLSQVEVVKGFNCKALIHNTH